MDLKESDIYSLVDACALKFRGEGNPYVFARATGDQVLASLNLAPEVKIGFFQYLNEVLSDRFRGLPVSRWLLRLASQSQTDWLMKSLTLHLHDPWSLSELERAAGIKASVELNQAIFNRHSALEAWLMTEYGLQLDSVTRAGQGSSMGEWIGALQKQARRLSEPELPLAALALLSAGPLRGEVLFAKDPIPPKKSWRGSLFKDSFSALGFKSIDKLKQTEDFRAAALELQSDPRVQTDLRIMRAIYLLSTALGASVESLVDIQLERFPGELLMPFCPKNVVRAIWKV